jgi:hypothetical protein
MPGRQPWCCLSFERSARCQLLYHGSNDLLAADRGPRKASEPFLVTLNDKSEIFPDFEHPGTGLIHELEGRLRYRHGHESYLLRAGDTSTCSGAVPHGPQTLLKLPIRLLSSIVYGEQ